MNLRCSHYCDFLKKKKKKKKTCSHWGASPKAWVWCSESISTVFIRKHLYCLHKKALRFVPKPKILKHKVCIFSIPEKFINIKLPKFKETNNFPDDDVTSSSLHTFKGHIFEELRNSPVTHQEMKCQMKPLKKRSATLFFKKMSLLSIHQRCPKRVICNPNLFQQKIYTFPLCFMTDRNSQY